MNSYNVEFFFKNNKKLDTSSMKITTVHNLFNINNLSKLENYIKNMKKYEKVVITFVKKLESE